MGVVVDSRMVEDNSKWRMLSKNLQTELNTILNEIEQKTCYKLVGSKDILIPEVGIHHLNAH